jgi:phenylalanyl-tRNA synthetase beta chain
MKVTISWLREFVDLPDDPDEVAAGLESLGHEIEGVEHLASEFRGTRVVEVTAIRPHPNADRIRLATVSDGTDVREVVCGAWNFAEGDVVVLAPPGSVLAGGLEVDAREIRGVPSPGMICSERELGLGDDHEGILVLDGAPELGGDFADLVELPDVVFDLSITTNRPDAMGVVGLARDLAAHFDVPLRQPDTSVPETGPPTEVTVTIDSPDGCPRYTAREVRDVAVGPAPLWMRMRLMAVGLRPINNVVDITNYVMMELGHPTHGFDRDLLGDTIVVRRAHPGEHLRTLDDIDRTLRPEDVVIADAERAIAFGGVIGGEDTEVNDATTNVLIEAAYFDPVSVMLTSKHHAVRTDASARFERGMDPNAADLASGRVARLLVELAGGSAASGRIDVYPEPIAPITLELPAAEPERVLGFPLTPAQIRDYLNRLGFEASGDDPIVVVVPTRRPDIDRPVDLLEELARLHGYDKIPETVAIGPGGGIPLRWRRLRKVRRAMTGAGYSESLAMSFLAENELEALGLGADDPLRRVVRVTNPLREDENVLRPTMLPGLLRGIAANAQHGLADVGLFEIGRVFHATGGGRLPAQPEMLAFAATGRPGAAWRSAGDEADAMTVAGTWSLLADVMEVEDPWVRQAAIAGFHPGRAAEVGTGDRVIGRLGELHPRVAAAYGIEARVAVAELELDPLVADPGLWAFRPPSPYPPVIFDLAFEVVDDVPAAAVMASARSAAGALLERLVVFDVFSGPPLPPGRTSIALRLTLRAPDRTLTDEDAAPVRREIALAVEAATGGRLRGATT